METRILDDVKDGPMSRFQVQAVALCVLMNMLDGFDVLAMAFVGPHISAEWHLTGTQLGLLLSAGLFGMAAGSVVIAPTADRFGRRLLILLCLPTIAIGMLCSAFAQDTTQLVILRLVTGIGIGGILPSINVITSEYATNRWRNTAISLEVSGYPIGATLGGLAAGWLLVHYGWRGVFVFGGVLTGLLVPLVMKGLPESIDFLVARQPVNALQKLNHVFRKMGRPAVAELPAIDQLDPGRTRRSWTAIISGDLAARTIVLCLSWLLVMFSVYFVLSWTPKLIVAAGMTPQQGLRAGILLNVGGIFGGTLFGLFALKFSTRLLLRGYFIFTAALFTFLGLYIASPTYSSLLAVIGGAGAFGCMVGMYALTPVLYPPECRNTAMGWAIGVGRLGAVIAPIAAGALVDQAWAPAGIYCLFALPLLVAVVTVSLARQSRRNNSDARRSLPSEA
ncbi:MFS transporter [Paraburkholderia madseniana]|jgi:benzoate transport|uniref:MFS transporter n=1 Tax=Paraburkholderia madseniana TaxID=2599607 RepID=UPI0038BC439F